MEKHFRKVHITPSDIEKHPVYGVPRDASEDKEPSLYGPPGSAKNPADKSKKTFEDSGQKRVLNDSETEAVKKRRKKLYLEPTSTSNLVKPDNYPIKH